MIGLTGGYASGKSLAGSIFEKLGAFIIDCDKISRDICMPDEPGYEKIVEKFGDEYLCPDKTINRTKLGQKIFSDEQSRQELEAILHPLIREEIYKSEKKAKKNFPSKPVILIAPLLFEGGLYKETKPNVLIVTEVENQIRWGMKRDRLNKESALKRIKAQWPLEKKRALADMEIENNTTAAELETKIESMWKKVNDFR